MEELILRANEKGMMQEWALVNLVAAADCKSRVISCSGSTCGLQRSLN